MPTPARDPDDAEELSALVSELEATLRELRGELADRDADDRTGAGGHDRDRRRGDDGRGRRDRSDRRSGPVRRDRRDRRPRPSDRRDRRGLPRPPGPGELLRFTTDYTIPTVVAVLEATIEALELLRGLLDLAAPGDSPDGDRRARRGGRARREGGGRRDVRRSVLADLLNDGVSTATDRAAGDAADALVGLRDALSAADLPEDAESRDLVADARDLSAELERRVRESRDAVDRERERERREGRADRTDRGGRDDGPVTIEVGDPDDADDGGTDEADARGGVGSGDARDGADDTGADDDADGESSDAPEVDVDAELESIRRQMGKGTDDGENGTDTDTGGGDGGDADDSAAGR